MTKIDDQRDILAGAIPAPEATVPDKDESKPPRESFVREWRWTPEPDTPTEACGCGGSPPRS